MSSTLSLNPITRAAPQAVYQFKIEKESQLSELEKIVPHQLFLSNVTITLAIVETLSNHQIRRLTLSNCTLSEKHAEFLAVSTLKDEVRFEEPCTLTEPYNGDKTETFGHMGFRKVKDEMIPYDLQQVSDVSRLKGVSTDGAIRDEALLKAMKALDQETDRSERGGGVDKAKNRIENHKKWSKALKDCVDTYKEFVQNALEGVGPIELTIDVYLGKLDDCWSTVDQACKGFFLNQSKHPLPNLNKKLFNLLLEGPTPARIASMASAKLACNLAMSVFYTQDLRLVIFTFQDIPTLKEALHCIHTLESRQLTYIVEDNPRREQQIRELMSS